MSGMLPSEEVAVFPDHEKRLLRHKNFLLLWVAGFFNGLALSIFLFSESWYVVKVLDREAAIGLILMAGTLPRLMLMLVGGVLADRLSRVLIMQISLLIRTLLLGGLALIMWSESATFWVFLIFSFFFGILDAFFWPAEQSIIPAIVKKEQLTRANALVQTFNQLSLIFGPLLAGLIIVWGGYTVVFFFASLLALGASVLLLKMNPHTNKEDSQPGPQGILLSVIEGLRYVKGSNFLITILLAAVFINLFIVGPLFMGLPIFIKNILQGSTLEYSYLEGSIAFGMLAGSALLGIFNPQKKRGKIIIFGLILMSVCFTAFSLTSSLWQSAVILFLLGLSISGINIPIFTLTQSIVEPQMIGRVMSLLSLSSLGLVPVSYGVTSLLLWAGLAIDTVMLAGSLLFFLLICILLRWGSSVRKMD